MVFMQPWDCNKLFVHLPWNNTVKYCDLIYVLEDGKLIDQGSFKEIFNKYGYLKEMNIK